MKIAIREVPVGFKDLPKPYSAIKNGARILQNYKILYNKRNIHFKI